MTFKDVLSSVPTIVPTCKFVSEAPVGVIVDETENGPCVPVADETNVVLTRNAAVFVVV